MADMEEGENICDRLVELAADRKSLSAYLKLPTFPLNEYTEFQAAKLIRELRENVEVREFHHGVQQSIDIPEMLARVRNEDARAAQEQVDLDETKADLDRSLARMERKARIKQTYHDGLIQGMKLAMSDQTASETALYGSRLTEAYAEANANASPFAKPIGGFMEGDVVRHKEAYRPNGRKDRFEVVAFREGQCLLWGPLDSAMSSGSGCDPVWLEKVAD